MGQTYSCCDERPKFSVEPSLLRRTGEQTARYRASPAASCLPTSSEGLSLRIARLVHAQFLHESLAEERHRSIVWKYCEPEQRTRGSMDRKYFAFPIAFEDLYNAFTLWMVEDRLVISDPNSLGLILPRDAVSALHFWDVIGNFMVQLQKTHRTRVVKKSIVTKESGNFVMKIAPVNKQGDWAIYVYDWQAGDFNDPFYAADSGIFVSQTLFLSLSGDLKQFRLLDTTTDKSHMLPVGWKHDEPNTIKEVKDTCWFAAAPSELLPHGLMLFSVKYRTGKTEERKVFRVDFFQDQRHLPWTCVHADTQCLARQKHEFVQVIGNLNGDAVVLERKDGTIGIVRFDRPDLGLVLLGETTDERELTYIDEDDKHWHVWRNQAKTINCDCKIELAKRNRETNTV